MRSSSSPSDTLAPEGVAAFRIQQVSELTGVPQPTLRAWERRYGVPCPLRTESGYRLYGRREVDVVLVMKRLSESGVTASEAAKEARARVLAPARAKRGAASIVGKSPVAERIVAAAVAFDEGALRLELSRLLLAGAADDAVDEAVVDALREIGALWHQGVLSVAQEHLASQHIGGFLRNAIGLSRPAPREKTAVLACIADETHEIGLFLVGKWLASWGYRPVVLGARVPPRALADAVRAVRPSVVALSTTAPLEKAVARELMAEYAQACRRVPMLVGGQGAAVIADEVALAGGHLAPHTKEDLRAAVMLLGRGVEKRGDPS